MELIARTRLIVDVPFAFECAGPDESGHDEDRVDAARHAETELVDRIKNALAEHGNVVEVLVEEVREA